MSEQFTKLRRQAEELIEIRPNGDTSHPAYNILQLIHELEVHQTELELQNEELKRSRDELDGIQRQYQIYDFAPSVYLTLSPKGIITRINLTGAVMLGAERGNLIHLAFTSFVSASCREAYHAAIKKARNSDESQRVELRVVDQSGMSRNSVHRHIRADVGKTGDVKEYRLVLADITDRKRVEEDLRETQIHMILARKRAGMANWKLDLRADRFIGSAEFYEMFGLDPAAAESASFETFIGAIHPEDRERVRGEYRDSIKNRRPYDALHRIVFSDGSIRYARETCYTEYAADGTPLCSYGIAQDVTGTVQSELELILARQRAEKADRLKSAFLANMSHEIRTPLTAVLGYTDLMLAEQLSAEHREWMETISSSGKLLLSLLGEILDLSRIEADEIKIDKTHCSLSVILNDVDDSANILLAKSGRGVKIRRHVAAHIQDSFLGDPLRLRQVLLNLISNAVKFTHYGSIEYGVSLKNEQTLEFYVRDSGAGILPDQQELIFQPFQRSESLSWKTRAEPASGWPSQKNWLRKWTAHCGLSRKSAKTMAVPSISQFRLNPPRPTESTGTDGGKESRKEHARE